jgi:hypothetical protein
LQSPADIIARFETELAAAGCEIVDYESSNTQPADYRAFEYFPGKGKKTFINRIGIAQTALDREGRIVPRPPAEILVSRWHDGTHARQANTIPAAHFTLYNKGNLNIVLTPESYVKYVLATERAAMATTAMLGFLDGTPEMREALKKEPVTFEDYESAFNASGGNHAHALNRVMRECLMKNSNEYMPAWGGRQKDEALYLYNFYCWQALKTVHDSNRIKFADKLYDLPKPIFVRLDDEDFMQIGSVLGFNGFGEDRPDTFFTARPDFMEYHNTWLQGLNLIERVPPENEAPTLRQALANYYGITPEEGMAFSKQYKQGDPYLPLLGPDASKVVPFIP